MKVAALFSGGKDSTYAAYVAVQRGWDLASLITVVPTDPESMMFHVPNIHLTPLLAEAIGRPHILERAAPGEPGELDALARAIRRADVDAVVVGAIASDYQHSRVNRVGDELGIRVFAPLWRQDPGSLLRDYLESGMDIRFVACAAEGFTPSWLGRRLDAAARNDLLNLHATRGVHPCGEGGEFETIVLDSPMHCERIEIARAEALWSGSAGVLRIDEARRVPKTGS